ncbi:MAG: hypothetical protein IT510_12330 [Sulfuritalea sp.]|nr:hypothetical protein [Sulfuritalea sp.]
MTSEANYDSFRASQFRGPESEAINIGWTILRGRNRAERPALAGKTLSATLGGAS